MNGNANYFRHVYILDKALKSYSIYQLDRNQTSSNLLTDILRIEVYRQKSKATNIEHYLRLRTTNNWSKCEQVTGLRKYSNQIYYGDRRKAGRKSLLIMK